MPRVQDQPRNAAGAFFAYYIALYIPIAINISFFPLWIKAQGLSESQVGLLFSVGAVLGVIVNPVVGHLADTRPDRKRLLLWLCTSSAIAACALLGAQGFLPVHAAYVATRACSASLIPLSESIAIGNTTRHGFDFGRLRSVGSLSVVVTAVLLGWLIDHIGIAIVAYTLAATYLLQTFAATRLPDVSVPRSARVKAPLREVWLQRGYPLFLVAGAASQACHGLFYTYSAIHWKAIGLAPLAIGWLWALGVLVEVVAFAWGSRLLTRFTPQQLILIGCSAGVLRWSLIAEADGIAVLLLAQLLQAATLGFTQLGAAQFIRLNVPAPVMSSGTGLYAAVSGVLTAVAIYTGSQWFGQLGGQTFLIGSVICGLGVVAATLLVRRMRGPE
jgi:PPP family 3-phenylpropionic acid transporter